MKRPGHRSHVAGVRRFLSGKKAGVIQDKLRAQAKRLEASLQLCRRCGRMRGPPRLLPIFKPDRICRCRTVR